MFLGMRRSIFASLLDVRALPWSVSLIIFLVASTPVESNTTANADVKEDEIQAVIQAIKDEIYSHNYQKEYFDLGTDRIPIYVNPRRENEMVWVIYKLMPHGEILRGAFIRDDMNLAILVRDPEKGFPPTNSAAMKTVYLDDDQVIKMKTTWKRKYFSIDLNPSAKELQEAKRRQEIRFKLKRQ